MSIATLSVILIVFSLSLGFVLAMACAVISTKSPKGRLSETADEIAVGLYKACLWCFAAGVLGFLTAPVPR